MATGAADHPVGGNPVWVAVLGIGLIVLLGYLQHHSEHLMGNGIVYNTFNFATIILVTMIGFVLMKVFVTKFPIPGVTQFVHAA